MLLLLAVRLQDFGLARVLGDASSVTADVSGTFAFMAPEVFDGQICR